MCVFVLYKTSSNLFKKSLWCQCEKQIRRNETWIKEVDSLIDAIN